MHEFLRRQFKVGEKRTIEWQITPNSKLDTIVITEAKYTVYSGGAAIKSGNADINGLTLSCLFEAENEGCYMLELTVIVPPETVKTSLYIDVTR